MKWLLFIALAVALVVVLSAMMKKGGRPASARGGEGDGMDLADLKPTDARRGDTVSVLAMGADYDDLDFVVDRINRYEAGGDRWTELSGTYRGGRVYLELYQDDVLEIGLVRPQDEIRFADLPLSEADLIRFDESQTGSFEWNGAAWDFEEAGEVFYFEDGKGAGEGCYSWCFAEAGGDRFVYVEKWEGEPFEAGMGTTVRPGDVRVFRA